MATRTLKKDAEKGWSRTEMDSGNTLDPIDGCQVVYRDRNRDERVNITFSLLFRPYLGFYWEPEAFFSDYTFKKRLSAHQQTNRCVKWPRSEPSEAKVSFSLCFFCTKYRKITRCGLSADLGIPALNLSMFGPSPHCDWNHQTCWLDRAQVIQQVQSEQVFSLKPFYSFRSEAVPGRSSEGNGRLLLAWVNNIMQRARRRVCLWVDVLLPVRIIAHVHWCLGFVWFDGWLLSCSCFWGFWRRVELEKKDLTSKKPSSVMVSTNARKEFCVSVCFHWRRTLQATCCCPLKKNPNICHALPWVWSPAYVFVSTQFWVQLEESLNLAL